MATKKKVVKKTVAHERELALWKKKGEALAKAKSGNQWKIAEWMRDGVEGFKRKVAYAEAAEITGMKVETLRTFFSVAKNIKASTRVDGLSFGHHRLVAGLDEGKQKTALAWAEKRDMSVHTFADWIQKEEKKLERRQQNAAAKADPNYHGDRMADAVIKRISPLFTAEKSLQSNNGSFLEMKMNAEIRNALLEKIRKAEACLARWAKALESKGVDKALPATASGD
jgi:hypothetical protein